MQDDFTFLFYLFSFLSPFLCSLEGSKGKGHPKEAPLELRTTGRSKNLRQGKNENAVAALEVELVVTARGHRDVLLAADLV